MATQENAGEQQNKTEGASEGKHGLRVGILGAGNIGGVLANRLSAAGYNVKVANSRGPETIPPNVLATGARAVTKEDAIKDVDVLIVSIRLNYLPELAPLLIEVPETTTVIDTSGYYPQFNGKIDALENGQVEALWIVELFGGRPIAKAWNAVGQHTFATKGKSSGCAGRIALPFAADRESDRKITEQLLDASGFDAVYAGTLAESWRIQPGSPAYCTDLTREEMPDALAAAERERLHKRRNLWFDAITERFQSGSSSKPADPEVASRLARALFL